jgi:hypothetical protein
VLEFGFPGCGYWRKGAGMKKSEYEAKLKHLQDEIEELKKVEIEEETEFIPGELYKTDDGKVAICISSEGRNKNTFTGQQLCKHRCGFMNRGVMAGWVKKYFTHLPMDQVEITVKVKE